jgi:hypothetical protein
MLAGPAAHAQGTVLAPCKSIHAFNIWHQFSFHDEVLRVTIDNIQFFYDVGTLNSPYGQTFGVYKFDNLVDPTQVWGLRDPTYGVQSCFETPTTGPPLPVGDTTWVDEYILGGYGGTVYRIYYADVETCSDGSSGGEGGREPPPPPEDCSGGAGGGDTSGGTQVEVCEYLVLADEYGNPILDAGGDYIIIMNLGCYIEQT